MPDSTAAQHHFRTGWIMIHLPGDPPNAFELSKSVAILQQHMADWNLSTLGRGTMNNTLFDDCNCNGMPDECECLGDIDGDGSVGVTDFLALLGARALVRALATVQATNGTYRAKSQRPGFCGKLFVPWRY